MVTIRLARGGAKKRPFYHLVVADKARSLGGRFVERLGYYNPIATGQEIKLSVDKERFSHWVGVGAQLSARVTTLMKDLEKHPELAQPVASYADKRPKKEVKKAAPAKAVEAEAPATEAAPAAKAEKPPEAETPAVEAVPAAKAEKPAEAEAPATEAAPAAKAEKPAEAEAPATEAAPAAKAEKPAETKAPAGEAEKKPADKPESGE